MRITNELIHECVLCVYGVRMLIVIITWNLACLINVSAGKNTHALWWVCCVLGGRGRGLGVEFGGASAAAAALFSRQGDTSLFFRWHSRRKIFLACFRDIYYLYSYFQRFYIFLCILFWFEKCKIVETFRFFVFIKGHLFLFLGIWIESPSPLYFIFYYTLLAHYVPYFKFVYANCPLVVNNKSEVMTRLNKLWHLLKYCWTKYDFFIIYRFMSTIALLYLFYTDFLYYDFCRHFLHQLHFLYCMYVVNNPNAGWFLNNSESN